jgi:hypothetical protein
MISSGNNLKILIDAPYSFFGDWSGFAICYSIRKYLPEAEVYLDKKKKSNVQYFNWMEKLKIKYFPTSVDFVLPSHCLAVRTLDDSLLLTIEILLSESKEDKFTPFVSYKEGCARFVMSDWINSNEYPFPYADKLVNKGMCSNEIQVLRLWKQMNALYPLLVKG